jgi:hypothetical protein
VILREPLHGKERWSDSIVRTRDRAPGHADDSLDTEGVSGDERPPKGSIVGTATVDDIREELVPRAVERRQLHSSVPRVPQEGFDAAIVSELVEVEVRS